MANPAQTLMDALSADPEIAWAWFCNIAVPIMDTTGCGHQKANEAAAFVMSHLLDYDITTHPLYEYGKSSAHEYTELRIAAERKEYAAAKAAAEVRQ